MNPALIFFPEEKTEEGSMMCPRWMVSPGGFPPRGFVRNGIGGSLRHVQHRFVAFVPEVFDELEPALYPGPPGPGESSS